MAVDSPSDGAYRVTITGDSVNLDLSAKEVADKVYEAQSPSATWSFTMVDDKLLTATANPSDGPAVSTSFKRVGG